MKRIMTAVICCYVLIGASAQNNRLGLEFASFDKLTNTYTLNDSILSKEKFVQLMNTNQRANQRYTEGKSLRASAGIVALVSASSLVYFTDQFLKDETAFDLPETIIFSYMGLMGAAMLNFSGKNRMQLGVKTYNGESVSYENRIRVNLGGGLPAFGLWSSVAGEQVSQPVAFGLGVEAHLYKRWFGYVDAYSQKAVTTVDRTSAGVLKWDEEGESLIAGIGLDYEVAKRFHVIGKYGLGITSIDRDVSFDDEFFKREENELSQAVQMGLGLRYFPVDHFAFGANVNLTTTTPFFNFAITGAF
jgi:hypothetical protein